MHYCYSGRPRPTRSDTTDALPACVPATPSPCGPTNGPRSCVLGAWGCTSKISCRQVQIPMPTLGRNGNPPSSHPAIFPSSIQDQFAVDSPTRKVSATGSRLSVHIAIRQFCYLPLFVFNALTYIAYPTLFLPFLPFPTLPYPDN